MNNTRPVVHSVFGVELVSVIIPSTKIEIDGSSSEVHSVEQATLSLLPSPAPRLSIVKFPLIHF